MAHFKKLFILALVAGLLACTTFAQKGYVTQHNYAASQSLSTVACSDGANGLITKTKQSTLAKWFPNVGAASFAGWNSPNCGTCYKLSASNGKSVKITVIDQCANQPGYAAHFDVAPPAFTALGGGSAGHIEVTYSKC